jgi:hypothetical protein
MRIELDPVQKGIKFSEKFVTSVNIYLISKIVSDVPMSIIAYNIFCKYYFLTFLAKDLIPKEHRIFNRIEVELSH